MDDSLRIATHEAGHAVVGLALGGNVFRAHLGSEGGRRDRPVTTGGVEWAEPLVPWLPLWDSVVALGGLAAEHAFGFARYDDLDALRADGRTRDKDFIDAIRWAAVYYAPEIFLLGGRRFLALSGDDLSLRAARVLRRHALALAAHCYTRARVFLTGDGRDATEAVARALLRHRRADGQELRKLVGAPRVTELLPRLPSTKSLRAAINRLDPHVQLG